MSGVFHGDYFSPLLFCISLLLLSVELKRGNRYLADPPSKREHKVIRLLYMDDVIEKFLRVALEKVASYTTAIDMKLMLEK